MEGSGFTVVLSTDFHSKIIIPKELSEKLGAKLPEKVILKGANGDPNDWEVELETNHNTSMLLGDGWREFIDAYSLQEKNILTFKYIGNSIFEVSVFDGKKLCEKGASYSSGRTNARRDTRESSLDHKKAADWKRGKRAENQHIASAQTLEVQAENRSILLNAESLLQKSNQNCERYHSLLESGKRELEKLRQDYKKHIALCASVREKLPTENRKKFSENSQMVHKEADDASIKLVEQQKIELEDLNKKVLYLQNQLKAKQGLEKELETLKSFEAHLEDLQVKRNEFQEKEEDVEELKSLSEVLIVNERRVKDELAEAREELMNGLKEFANSTIGPRRMGQLDPFCFLEACKKKYPREIVEVKAVELFSLLEAKFQDPGWHPFKTILSDGVYKVKEDIDTDDEKLIKLKREWGEDVYTAITVAMRELNEYNPIERRPIEELWNYKLDRKATLREGADFILQKWRTNKRRKR